MLHFIVSWLLSTPLHHVMVEWRPGYPVCQSLHFIGLALLIGSLLLVDLRALGMFRQMPLLAMHRLVPVALIGFGINGLTGFLFLCFDPEAYFKNVAFLAKMSLLPFAGLNALAFEIFVFRPLLAGKHEVADGTFIKVSSAGSLLLWTGVLIGGRLIAFV